MQEKVVETVSQVSAESLKQIMEWIRQGVETAKEQIPQVANEIVRYGRIKETIYIIALPIAVFLLCLLTVKLFKTWKHGDEYCIDSEEMIGLFGSLFIAAGVVILSLAFLFEIEPFLLAWFAPKLYVLNYLKEFLK
jgi:hypothetical protein